MIGLSATDAKVFKMLALKQALGYICETVWDQYGIAKSEYVDFHEESITQGIVLSLSHLRKRDTFIHAFSKARETKIGSDWIWLFTSADHKIITAMLVQAKRLGRKERSYTSLNHRSGRPREYQLKRLISSSAAFGLDPYYAFYNHLNHYKIKSDCCIASSENIWGVSLAPALLVEPYLLSKQFSDIYPNSFPLPCIICQESNSQVKSVMKIMRRAGTMLDNNNNEQKLKIFTDFITNKDASGIRDATREMSNIKGIINIRIDD